MNDIFSITCIFSKKLHEIINGATASEAIEKVNGRITVREMQSLLDGEYSPNIVTLCNIADAYGVTTDYLLGRTEEKEPAPAAAGQAHKEISNTNSIAQTSEVVNNFTFFPSILTEFARQCFGDIEVKRILAFDDITAPDNLKRAEIEFTDCADNRYRIRVEGIKEEEP